MIRIYNTLSKKKEDFVCGGVLPRGKADVQSRCRKRESHDKIDCPRRYLQRIFVQNHYSAPVLQ